MTYTEDVERAVKEFDPDDLAKQIGARGAQAFADGLIDSLTRHNNCPFCKCSGRHVAFYRLFARVTRLIKTEPAILAAVIGRLGARDEEHLARLVGSGRRLEQLKEGAEASYESFRDDAVELLITLFTLHPDWRDPVVKRLGSFAEEASWHIQAEATNDPLP